MTLEGYDISHHQTATPDLTGVDFVVCRATYGATPDRLFAMHSANARAAGKVVGAYHFARPVTTGDTVEEQVEAFLAAAPDADFYAVDREKDGDAGTITLADTRRLISLVRATGRRIGLYASESSFRELGQDWSWVARWSSMEPTIPWDIWQWEGGGADQLDNDKFRGTRGALLALGAPIEEWVNAQVAARDEQIVGLQHLSDKLASELATTATQLEATQAALAQANAAVAELETDSRAAANAVSYLESFSLKYRA
jgi:hypothetical protein